MEYFYEEFYENTGTGASGVADHRQSGMVLFCL